MKLISALLFYFFFFGNLESKKIFNAKEFYLDNGLRVIVVENKRAPVVSQMIWYNFGSGVERKGQSGLAHFMEHLMFKGTSNFPKNYYSNFISRVGGSENAFTSYDYTAYFQIFPSQHTEKIIEMEADRMKNIILDKDLVETEKLVILEERYQRIDSDPSSILDESMKSILFPNDYYGRPIIGWKSEIENLSYENVIDFYKKNYGPNNAVLILSGDIDLDSAKSLTKKYYGAIDRVDDTKKHTTQNPLMKTSVFVEHSNKDIRQSIWKKLYRTKSYTDSIIDGIALDIGLKILMGGSSSLLYDKLVNDKKIFSMVGGFYQGLSKGDGYIYVYAIPIQEITPRKINNLLNDEIKSSINNITKEMIEIEKKKYIHNSVYRMDGILKPSEIIGEAISVGLELDDIENWNQNLKRIDMKMVKDSLTKFYNNKDFVIGNLIN